VKSGLKEKVKISLYLSNKVYLYYMRNTNTASQILAKGQKSIKAAYLIDTIEELISERDRMDSNWNDSMRERMQTISKISLTKFNTPLSSL
jgi:hypothetical protein